MLRRDRHRGAAHQVIEPEVFRRLPREKSFQPALANHFGHKLPRPIKQREKTVPIHREQKPSIRRNQAPRDGNAASRSVSFRRSNRSTASTAGNSGTNTRSYCFAASNALRKSASSSGSNLPSLGIHTGSDSRKPLSASLASKSQRSSPIDRIEVSSAWFSRAQLRRPV